MSKSKSVSPRSRVTMRDVALASDVSIMTVSNVINGRGGKVGPGTRERVLRAIDELGYRVNPTARSLRKGRTGVVCLAIPDMSSLYYGELADRLARTFAAHGMQLVVEPTGAFLEAELASLSQDHLEAYDGLILNVSEGDAEDLDRVSPHRPVVLIGERAISRVYDHVLMDNIGGSLAATRYFIRTGARRIALLGGQIGDRDSMPELRTRGYLQALALEHIDIDPDLVRPTGWGYEDAYQEVRDLCERGVPFEAVLCVTDTAALGALRALADAGRRVPADVQVMGWDAVELGQYSVPRLSTVDPSNDAIAEAITSLLVSRIADPDKPEKQVLMPTASLLLRESTLSE